MSANFASKTVELLVFFNFNCGYFFHNEDRDNLRRHNILNFIIVSGNLNWPNITLLANIFKKHINFIYWLLPLPPRKKATRQGKVRT